MTCERCKERFVEPLTWVYSLAVNILVEMVRRWREQTRLRHLFGVCVCVFRERRL